MLHVENRPEHWWDVFVVVLVVLSALLLISWMLLL
jgi:hypothetical protein